jgi:long-chain fatty acid transport protein
MQASIKLFLPFLSLTFSLSAFGQCSPISDPDCTPSIGATGFSGLPIDQLPPGARSLGLAGAFVGVADDATAAIANPGGLTILTAKEISINVRNSDSDVGFFDPDAFDSTASNAGTGRMNKQYSDSNTDVSFASFVLPFDRWVFSAYYSNQLNFASYQNGGPDVVTSTELMDTYLNDNSIDASLDSYGISGAFRVTDSFSIGLTVSRSKLDMKSMDNWQVDNFFDVELDLAGIYPEFTKEEYADVVLDEFLVESTIDENKSDTTFSLGLLYSLNSSWSFGVVYRQGAEFNVSTNTTGSYNLDCTGDSGATANCQDFLGDIIPISRMFDYGSTPSKIQVPDTISFGIGWRPSDVWLVSFDVNRIGYGDTTPIRTITQGLGLDVNSAGQLTEEIKDGTTFHLGVEKVFVLQSNNTISIRGGAFTIEDHDGIKNIDSDDTAFTVGIGTTFGSNSQFQLDLGASFADATNNVLLSGIYRF